MTRSTLLLVGALLGALVVGCRSESYVLAEGSKPGWVVLEFENPKCPAMESGWLGRDFFLPESGYLCTSSPIDGGYVYERYYLLRDNGRREHLDIGKEIHGRSGLNLTLEGCRLTATVFRYDGADGAWDSGEFIREHHPECRGTIAWPSEAK